MSSHESNNERLQEACMVALRASGGELGITLLNKTLFYADLFALRDLGAPITNAKYVALKRGPVVERYKDRIVNDLALAGLAVQVEHHSGYGKPLRVTGGVESCKTLSPSEIVIVEGVARLLSDKQASSISELSHKNPGWTEAFDEYRNGESINMLLALQQLADDDDPWMQAPADDEFCSVITRGYNDANNSL